MKITKIFTVECCKKQKSFNEEYEAVDYLFIHICKFHKGLFKQLDIQGKNLARSQNGYGYYDNHGEGWKKAQTQAPYFVKAWIKEALRKRMKLR